MKWSDNFLIPTLKESPSEAESKSHKLMIRAGLMRKLASGLYSYLPLGQKVLLKVMTLVRKHMNLAGAQEVFLPALQPAELWRKSGRFELLGKDMFCFKDRADNEMVLGPTHEEVITELMSRHITSYKQLPQILYQIQTKFRDEPRPRCGVIRSKEFIMKDAYSFDADEESLDRSYEIMRKAYVNLFTECGLEFNMVEADPGFMGGSQSAEFMILSESGEDTIVTCDCGAAYSLDAAVCPESRISKKETSLLALKEISTPSKTTIEEVSRFLDVSADKLLKTIIYEVLGESPVAVLIKGDNHINEVKLGKLLGGKQFNLAGESTILNLTKSRIGFSGPIGLSKEVRIIADYAVGDMENFVCGANKDDTHLMNVNITRDFEVDEYADLRYIQDGDVCPKCGKEKIELKRAIEIGHIFKLGQRYTKAFGVTYLDADQKEKPVIMGCYGLGVNRIAAACIEQNNDEKGISWPVSLSPFEVVMIVLNSRDEKVSAFAEKIYGTLNKAGIDVIMDLRDERAGVKFNDADLIGFYLKLVISSRNLAAGMVEVSFRAGGGAKNIKAENIEQEVKKLLDKNSPA